MTHTENPVSGVLEMTGVSIEFPGVRALDGVDFRADAGRAHALIGANGAGKSTLMKVLSGAYEHYTGDIAINGERVRIRTPREAKELGIQIVYQEVDTALIPSLSVGENIMLEELAHGMGGRQLVDWAALHRRAEEVLSRLGAAIPTRKLVQELTLAEKQMTLIARAASRSCRFLVLDEPTAPLSRAETDGLFSLVRRLKADGVGVIFISHRLPELFDICEEITVMRDGRVVHRGGIRETSQAKVVEHMLGAKLGGQFPSVPRTIGDVRFEARRMKDGDKVKGVDLVVRAGEIVGIAGLVGAGKTELCRALFGASPTAEGELTLDGSALRIRSPRDAVRAGIALVPEERRREGILVEESVAANLTAATLSRFAAGGWWMNDGKLAAAARGLIEKLGVKTPNERTRVRHLSGGNQQKIAIGKWLLADAEVYIFDEPTKGVDVGAKRDIYELITALAARGKCILYASSELGEIVGLADRAYVMYDGAIAKELDMGGADEETLLLYSAGGGEA